MKLAPMGIRYTSRKDLRQTLFLWRCACLGLWLILILFLTHLFPHDWSLLLFVLPAAGFFGIALIPESRFDFQGLVFSGSFFCCFLSPAIYGTLLEKRIWDLAAMALCILFAMAFGFGFFRLMGKALQRLS